MATETLRNKIEEHGLFDREILPQDAGKIVSVLQFQSTILKCLHRSPKPLKRDFGMKSI
jgi:hypothetical protein